MDFHILFILGLCENEECEDGKTDGSFFAFLLFLVNKNKENDVICGERETLAKWWNEKLRIKFNSFLSFQARKHSSVYVIFTCFFCIFLFFVFNAFGLSIYICFAVFLILWMLLCECFFCECFLLFVVWWRIIPPFSLWFLSVWLYGF